MENASKRKSFFSLSIAVLLLILPAFIPSFDPIDTSISALEDGDEVELIAFNTTHSGDVYSFKVFDGIIEDYRKVGYTDGNGNYYLDFFTVLENQSLKVESGVRIFIDEAMYIYGEMIVEGTITEPIYFNPNSIDPTKGSWGGFYVYDSIDETFILKNCVINGANGIYSNRDTTIINCEFQNLGGITINRTYGTSNLLNKVIINNTVFSGNSIDENYGTVHGISIGNCRNIYVNNISIFDYYSRFYCGSTEYLEVMDNYASGYYGASFRNSGDRIGIVKNNTIEYGQFSVGDSVKVENNTANIGAKIFGNGIFKNNYVGGFFGIDADRPKSTIKDNIILGDVTILKLSDEKIKLDLSRNTWRRDWNIEEILGMDDEDFEEDHPGLDLIFEPYYDKNGTLTDTDSLPNGWEAFYGLDIYENNDLEDPDNDDATNLDEYLAGGTYSSGTVDPTDPDSDNDTFMDGWELKRGMKPDSQDSDGDEMSGLYEITHHMDPTNFSQDADFETDYMLHPEKYPGINIDVDNVEGTTPGEGYVNKWDKYVNFTDYEEYLHNTDPNDCDTDNDGIEDGYEVCYGFDPLTNDSYLDFDEDGYSNLEEYLAGTPPDDWRYYPKEETNEENDPNLILIIIPISLVIALSASIAIALILVKKRKAQNYLETVKVKVKE